MKFGVVGLVWLIGFLMGFSIATVRITENITAFVDSTDVAVVEGSVIEPIDEQAPSESGGDATRIQPDRTSELARVAPSEVAEVVDEWETTNEPDAALIRESDTQEGGDGVETTQESADTEVATAEVALPKTPDVAQRSEESVESTNQETIAVGDVLAETGGKGETEAIRDLAWTQEPDSLIEAGKPDREVAIIEEPASDNASEWSVDTSSLDGGFQAVGFDFLAGFNYEVSDDFLLIEDGRAPDNGPEIPERVLALNQSPVAVTGFMMPLKVVEDDKVSEFLLLRSAAMCCYGQVPEVNEWISVTMTGKPTTSVMDRPVQVRGTLRVGEMREDGYLVGIYEMDGESLEIVAHEVD